MGSGLERLNPKCQDPSKFQLGGGLESENPKCQDLPKFQFWGGGFWKLKNFYFRGGGGCSEPNSRTGCSEDFEHKICLHTFCMPFASQIVSHILRMWRLIKVQIAMCVDKRQRYFGDRDSKMVKI